jgi:hypothetical protein
MTAVEWARRGVPVSPVRPAEKAPLTVSGRLDRDPATSGLGHCRAAEPTARGSGPHPLGSYPRAPRPAGRLGDPMGQARPPAHRHLRTPQRRGHRTARRPLPRTMAPNPPDTSPRRLTDSTIWLYADQARHQQRTHRSHQRPARTPPRLRPRLPQPHQLHRQIATGDRRIQTPTTPLDTAEPPNPLSAAHQSWARRIARRPDWLQLMTRPAARTHADRPDLGGQDEPGHPSRRAAAG